MLTGHFQCRCQWHDAERQYTGWSTTGFTYPPDRGMLLPHHTWVEVVRQTWRRASGSECQSLSIGRAPACSRGNNDRSSMPITEGNSLPCRSRAC
jgi:hypothetical protein